MNKKVTTFNIHIRAALGHLLDACTKTRNTATPRNVSINIIYRTFHILEIRVWVSTEVVSTEKVFVCACFFLLFLVFFVLFFFFILPIARGAYYLHKPSGWKYVVHTHKTIKI